MTQKIDRLSSLLARFELSFSTSSAAKPNFFVLGEAGLETPEGIVFFPRGPRNFAPPPDTEILLAAAVKWGGERNPFLCGLPQRVDFDLQPGCEIQMIVALLLKEMDEVRCGSGEVVSHLGEGMMVRLFRAQIERGAVSSGVLAGLADPRLSRAIVAMHDQPGVPWRVETLASEAGLSGSRFADLFRDTVGQPPLAYLREWRLQLARKDIENGCQVQTVASRYDYGSTEALSRAIKQAFGQTPRRIKQAAQEN